MPTSFVRPNIKTYNGDKFSFNLDEDVFRKVNEICKIQGITPFMFFLSAYCVLLSKYTSQNDLIIGTPVVGRSTLNQYKALGVFVNLLPIRTFVDSSITFCDLLQNIKKTCLKDFQYQDYPYDELVSKLNLNRNTNENPLFNTMFIYQNDSIPHLDFENVKAEYYIANTRTSKYDLSLEVSPNINKFNLSFEYSDSLFSKSFIYELAMHYSNIINSVLDNMDTKILDIPLISGEEENNILYKFNNTNLDYKNSKTIPELFQEQVLKTPDSIAVVFKNKEFTYKELNIKSNNLAHYIKNKGIKRNDIVGIMVNRSAEMLIAILAVLKAGATYIPIDPDYPTDRIKYMLDNSNAKLILTSKKLLSSVNFENKIYIDLINNDIYNSNLPSDNIKTINEPQDLAYIIYTSGSTGLPKGVGITHKNIVNLIAGVNNIIDFSNSKTIVSITTISFDIFIIESLLPLINRYEDNYSL